MEIDYTRKITHTGYRNPKLVKKYFHRVPKNIYEKPSTFDKGFKKVYLVLEDFLIETDLQDIRWVFIFLLGGVFLFSVLIHIFSGGDSTDFFYLIEWIAFIFFVIYGLTMPKQEAILNRIDGLITFDGFLWQDNITMPFSEVEFCYSTGGEDLQGAFQLQIMRPNKWVTFAIPIFSGKDCYEGMSFITWYMDKNRPLPPGELFDPYREADFQRRKAEGFPKPLYPSDIPTPEATPEQQAERERIGGW